MNDLHPAVLFFLVFLISFGSSLIACVAPSLLVRYYCWLKQVELSHAGCDKDDIEFGQDELEVVRELTPFEQSPVAAFSGKKSGDSRASSAGSQQQFENVLPGAAGNDTAIQNVEQGRGDTHDLARSLNLSGPLPPGAGFSPLPPADNPPEFATSAQPSLGQNRSLSAPAWGSSQSPWASALNRSVSELSLLRDGQLQPQTQRVLFQDPRNPGLTVGVVAFHHPGYDQPCDKLCHSAFLSNFWNIGSGRLALRAPNSFFQVEFSNAEAGFHALKIWSKALMFASLSGEQACRLASELDGADDPTYGGFGSEWEARLGVLRKKFAIQSMKDALLRTQDTYLLSHSSSSTASNSNDHGRIDDWSDGCSGECKNQLGMQLMLIRDEISGNSEWTSFIQKHIHVATGAPVRTEGDDTWQESVRRASTALTHALEEANRDQKLLSDTFAC